MSPRRALPAWLLVLLLAASAAPAEAQTEVVCDVVETTCQTTTEISWEPQSPEAPRAPQGVTLTVTVRYTYLAAGPSSGDTQVDVRAQPAEGLLVTPAEAMVMMTIASPDGTEHTEEATTTFQVSCGEAAEGPLTLVLEAEAQPNGMYLGSMASEAVDVTCPALPPAEPPMTEPDDETPMPVEPDNGTGQEPPPATQGNNGIPGPGWAVSAGLLAVAALLRRRL